MDVLYVVIPAYNEEENIEKVVRGWYATILKAGEGSRLVVIDDGSKDATYYKLKCLAEELPCILPLTRENSGHGATVMFGYNYAVENNADFIFQTDSDGQTLPEEFSKLWDARDGYNIQIGYRKYRQDGCARIVVTNVLKLLLFLVFGVWVKDANAPFRLMKVDETFKCLLAKLPRDYNLANVILTVLYEKHRSRIKMRYVPITFLPRQGGINSINLRKILQIGCKATRDFIAMRTNL